MPRKKKAAAPAAPPKAPLDDRCQPLIPDKHKLKLVSILADPQTSFRDGTSSIRPAGEGGLPLLVEGGTWNGILGVFVRKPNATQVRFIPQHTIQEVFLEAEEPPAPKAPEQPPAEAHRTQKAAEDERPSKKRGRPPRAAEPDPTDPGDDGSSGNAPPPRTISKGKRVKSARARAAAAARAEVDDLKSSISREAASSTAESASADDEPDDNTPE